MPPRSLAVAADVACSLAMPTPMTLARLGVPAHRRWGHDPMVRTPAWIEHLNVTGHRLDRLVAGNPKNANRRTEWCLFTASNGAMTGEPGPAVQVSGQIPSLHCAYFPRRACKGPRGPAVRADPS